MLYAPVDINWMSPTRRSATAKFMRRNVVLFSLLRFFQNTNMVKALQMKISKDSTIIMHRIAIA